MLKMSVVWILLVLGLFNYRVDAQCPDKSTLSCKNEGIPCRDRDRPKPKMTFFKLEDGTECSACQECFASVTECPQRTCVLQFVAGCKTLNTYQTYVKTLAGECPLCDVQSCLN